MRSIRLAQAPQVMPPMIRSVRAGGAARTGTLTGPRPRSRSAPGPSVCGAHSRPPIVDPSDEPARCDRGGLGIREPDRSDALAGEPTPTGGQHEHDGEGPSRAGSRSAARSRNGRTTTDPRHGRARRLAKLRISDDARDRSCAERQASCSVRVVGIAPLARRRPQVGASAFGDSPSVGLPRAGRRARPVPVAAGRAGLARPSCAAAPARRLGLSFRSEGSGSCCGGREWDSLTARRPVLRIGPDGPRRQLDSLAAEEPLELRVNGTPLAVTMRTPGHDVELAHGFLLTEGVLGAAADVSRRPLLRLAWTSDGHNTYNVLDVALAPGVRRRTSAWSATSTPPRRAGSAARRRWTRCGSRPASPPRPTR